MQALGSLPTHLPLQTARVKRWRTKLGTFVCREDPEGIAVAARWGSFGELIDRVYA